MPIKHDIPSRDPRSRTGFIRTRVDPVTYLVDFGGLGTELAFYSGALLLDVGTPVVANWLDAQGMWEIPSIGGVLLVNQSTTSGGEFSWGVCWYDEDASDILTGPDSTVVDASTAVNESTSYRGQNMGILSSTSGGVVYGGEMAYTDDGGETWATQGITGTAQTSESLSGIRSSSLYRVAWNGKTDDGKLYIGCHGDAGDRGAYLVIIDSAASWAKTINFAIGQSGGGPWDGVGVCGIAMDNSILVNARGFTGGAVAARSTDGLTGEAWTSVAGVPTSSSVHGFNLWPDLSTDDENDQILFRASGTTWDLVGYDRSGDAWDGAGTNIATSMASAADTSSAGGRNGVSIFDYTTGHIMAVIKDQDTSAGASLQVWDIFGTGSVTQVTDLWTGGGSDWVSDPGLTIDTNGVITGFYARDPENASDSSMNLYYKTSDDFGQTWSDETLYAAEQGQINAVMVDPRPVEGWGFVSTAGEGTPQTSTEQLTATVTGYTPTNSGNWNF